MQRRRYSYSSRKHRRLKLVLLASASLVGYGDPLLAQDPVVQVPSAPIPAERAGNDVQLLPPANSTLEIRIARRPWLLERLTRPSTPPAVKMDPPDPPPELAVPKADVPGQTSLPSQNVDPRGLAPVLTDSPASQAITPRDLPADAGEMPADGWATRPSQTANPSLQNREPSSASMPQETLSPELVTEPAARQQEAKQEAWNDQDAWNGRPANEASNTAANPTIRPTESDAARQWVGDQTIQGNAGASSLREEPPADNEEPVASSSKTQAARQFAGDEPLPLRDPEATDESSVTPLDVAEGSDLEEMQTDDVPLSDSELDPELDPSFDLLEEMVDGVEESEAVAVEMQPDAEDAEEASAESEAPADVEAPSEVTVRKLRINRDGSPAGGSGSAMQQPVEDEQPVDRDGIADAEVDDVPDQRLDAEVAEAEVSQAPEVELDYTGRVKEPIRLNSTVARMQGAMRQCLRYYHSQAENANERSNWGMLHSIMVYGADTPIIAGNRRYSAIAWIAGNNPCAGKRLIEARNGRISATNGIGLQGHQAQMLAIFALCDVPAEYPLYAGDQRFSVQDLVQEEKLACRSGEELTFTLIGLSHYMDTEAVWRNEDGEVWDFQRLIREELSQPIVGAACGGTHRLMGFGHALRKRRAEGRPITGQWKRAELYIEDFVQYTYRLQNRDGSMSTDWFEGREDNGDIDRKIQTTGHMVEWLLTVTPDSQLQDRRLVSAVRFLLNAMYSDRTHDWKIGPKGHALRSLAMYYERVYQQGPAWRSEGVASGSSQSRR